MDEDQSQAGQELDRPGGRTGGTLEDEQERTPAQVRDEIEQTRAQLGDTVAELASKADVKAQTQRAVDGARTTVTEKVAGLKQNVTGKKDDVATAAQQAMPESASQAGSRLTEWSLTHRWPLLAAGAFIAGLVLGRGRGRGR